MQIRIAQPDIKYPFAWAVIEVTSPSIGKPNVAAGQIYLKAHEALRDRGITLLGQWERMNDTFTAPVLLEYEHTKPRKRAKK